MAVLLVEDDPVIRLTLAELFENAGLRTIDVGNANDALIVLADPRRRINVLVTDINLGPGDNGLMLAGEAQQRQPNLPVIYITGSREMLVGHSFSLQEQVFYKPFDPFALTNTVSAIAGSLRSARRPLQVAKATNGPSP
jgi:DNA-binding NtrC family response regulator